MHTGTMSPENSSPIPYIPTYLLSQTPDSASPQLRPESLSALPVTPAEKKRDLSGNNEEPWPGKRWDYSSLHPILASLLRCGHEASGWGVPPDHFGPGGSKLGACRAVARLAEHAHLQGLAHGARGDPESGRRWGWTLWRQRVLSLCLPSPAVSTVARRPRPGSSRQMGPSPREQPSVAAPALLLPAGSSPGRAPGAAPLRSAPLFSLGDARSCFTAPFLTPAWNTQLVQNCNQLDAEH